VVAKEPTWRELADMLAERLSHHANCENGHTEIEPENCPFCRDRAVYQLWEAKSGRTHREPPYTGEVVDVLKDTRLGRRPGEEGTRSR
jgi:hypothetical protein